MDFSDALRVLKEGGTVRRAAWTALTRADPGEYATLRLTSPAPGFQEVFVVTTGRGECTMFNTSHSQILADDWEVVPP